MKQVSSRHHPLVAVCRRLARGRSSGDDRLLLDGVHLVFDSLRAGLHLDTVAMTQRMLATAEAAALVADEALSGTEMVEVSEAVMAAMSPVSTPSGLVGIAARPAWSLAQVFARAPQLAVVAVDVQEPGNAGAIVRAAEACGATGVAFCGASADPYGWKALRGSMGSALRLPLASAVTIDEALDAARQRGVRIIAAVPRGGQHPREVNLRRPAAFVLGGEGPGLPAEVIESADVRLSLPMRPPVESLNVAVAAALLVYEASNQRGAI